MNQAIVLQTQSYCSPCVLFSAPDRFDLSDDRPDDPLENRLALASGNAESPRGEPLESLPLLEPVWLLEGSGARGASWPPGGDRALPRGGSPKVGTGAPSGGSPGLRTPPGE